MSLRGLSLGRVIKSRPSMGTVDGSARCATPFVLNMGGVASIPAQIQILKHILMRQLRRLFIGGADKKISFGRRKEI